MKSWWNWLAKEVKRQPNAVTKPPKTAVRRVDFLRQIPIVIGEISNERQVDVAPNHPEKLEEVISTSVGYVFNIFNNSLEKYDGWLLLLRIIFLNVNVNTCLHYFITNTYRAYHIHYTLHMIL